MSDFSNTTSQNNDFVIKQPINIQEVIRKYLFHWPVFILCIFLSVGIMFIYLRYTPEVYNVKATLLIKDANQNNSNQANNQLNTFVSKQEPQNEMEILGSKMVMKQVVSDLNLNITYKIKGWAYNTELYNNRPFSVVFADKSRITNANWEIKIIDPNTYQILIVNSNTTLRGRFGVKEITPFGDCYIKKNEGFPAYLGKTMYVSFIDQEDEANAILKRLILSLGTGASSTINLSLNDEIPQRGKDILNDLIAVYNEASITDKNQAIKNSIRFINERLALIGKDLDSVEKDEENYKTSHGIIEVSSKASQYEEGVKENDSKLNEVNLQLGSLEAITHFVSNNKGTDSIPSMIGINDPIILNLVNQLGSLQAQREQLLATTGPANPIVKSKDKELRKVNTALINSVNNLHSSLNRTKNMLAANSSKFSGLIRTIPQEERGLVSIQRDKTIKENLYILLLQKKEEAALSSAETISGSRIVEPPYSLKNPISPQKGTLYLFSIIIGVFVPILYVFSKDSLNNKVINRKDITDRTSVPIIGDIMYRDSLSPIVINNNSRSIIAEQFRSARTNLQAVFYNQKESKVTLFTSSMPGEGKSFVSSNIAVSLAITNRKTVIIELDLRRPKVSQYMKQNSKVGLSNYLIGEANKEDIIQPSEIDPNLFLIGAGMIPPNPAELLEQQRMDDLIDWLKQEFAEIIIDTPPVGLVTDALVLSRFVDVSIYVVRHGVSLKKQINAIEELRQNKKFPRLNIVLNGVETDGRFGYGYETAYGYGYGGKGYHGSYYAEETLGNKPFSISAVVRDFLKKF